MHSHAHMMHTPRIVQLRQSFGLDKSEELYDQFSCAHTRPRWGAQFLQGHLYVFSSVMVFHANLMGVAKVERIHFRDVLEIRKRSFMRVPNTIGVSRSDGRGGVREDVFTSFMLHIHSRRKAFHAMVARWEAVNPEAADTFLASGCSTGSFSRGDTGGLDSSDSMSNPQSPCDLDGGLTSSAVGNAGVYRRGYNRRFSFGPGLPECLGGGVAHFPAWQELPAAVLPAAGDMALMAGADVAGIDAQTFAEVLLSDTSGFLPAAYKAQGNELVGLSPWQVVSAGRANPSAPPGSLSRTLQYIYSSASAWGTVRSLVVQDQVLLVGEGGRLVLLVTQRMPDLPAGVGKCFHISLRWDITPTAPPAAAVSAPAVTAPADHPASPHTPNAHQAAAGAAAGGGPDLPLLRTPSRAQQQQQVSAAAAASPFGETSSPTAFGTASFMGEVSVQQQKQHMAQDAGSMSEHCSPGELPVRNHHEGSPRSKSMLALRSNRSSSSHFAIVKGRSSPDLGAIAEAEHQQRGSHAAADDDDDGCSDVPWQAAVSSAAACNSPRKQRATSAAAALAAAVTDGAPAAARGSAAAGAAASENSTHAPANAASAAAPAASGVRWQVRGSVTFTKWHMAQSKVERDCLTTAGQSLTHLVARGVAWLQDEGSRQTLAEVMPHTAEAAAAATEVGQRHIALKPGGWPVHRTHHHRRSGSAGNSSGLRLLSSSSVAAAAAAAAAPAAAASNKAYSQQPVGPVQPCTSSNNNSVKQLYTVAERGLRFGRVLRVVLSVLGGGAEGIVGCSRAVRQGLQGSSMQQLVVPAVLLVVGVQLALLWQVVVLQGRVMQLLGHCV